MQLDNLRKMIKTECNRSVDDLFADGEEIIAQIMLETGAFQNAAWPVYYTDVFATTTITYGPITSYSIYLTYTTT